jgi:hypothetical protein
LFRNVARTFADTAIQRRTISLGNPHGKTVLDIIGHPPEECVVRGSNPRGGSNFVSRCCSVQPTACEMGTRLRSNLTPSDGCLMRVRHILIAFSSLAVVPVGLTWTPAASADSVQVQSYQRASQTGACAAQPGETPWQASWGPDSSWKPSWEQWANNGTGGWTCTRSITWARSGSSARSFALGDIGPGGGLVFLISGGLTYEMAPKAWGTGSAVDPSDNWCSNNTNSVATGTAVGTGSANTTAMQSPACTSGAGVSARAYRGGGLTDWFLPSKDELNAMCNYSRNPSAPAAPSISCSGGGGSSQDVTFASGAYGFATGGHWSSSQSSVSDAWAQGLGNNNGFQGAGGKIGGPLQVRPIRAF